MAVRPVFNKELEARFNERLDKYVARIYILWLLGVFVGILKLKPEKYSLNGVEFSITHPDALQGLIFFGCFAFYLCIVAAALVYGLQYSISNVSLKRHMIYLALGKKRTFRGLNTRQIFIVKKIARGAVGFAIAFVLFVLFLPLAHILLFERDALWIALNAMF